MRGLSQALIVAVALAVPPGFAQDAFPDKPVRCIVPFPPGGGTDAFARVVGAKLAELWGQQVVVDNRAGAQGNIGTALGAKAPADGYTITLAHQGALTINPHLYGSTGYDTLRDFAAVSRGMETASVLVVHPSVPATTMQELGPATGGADVRLDRVAPATPRRALQAHDRDEHRARAVQGRGTGGE
jgi:tripartite-type tricarboxylate transporter receptor subunit TctC